MVLSVRVPSPALSRTALAFSFTVEAVYDPNSVRFLCAFTAALLIPSSLVYLLAAVPAALNVYVIPVAFPVAATLLLTE
jgi:hypothetical protein